MMLCADRLNNSKGKDGHVVIVVEVKDGKVTVSENTSSKRGIGTHPISAQALATMAGLARWHK